MAARDDGALMDVFFIQTIRFSGYGKIQKEKRKEKARADWEYNQ